MEVWLWGKLTAISGESGEAGVANKRAAIIYICYTAFFYIEKNKTIIYQLLVRFNASFWITSIQ